MLRNILIFIGFLVALLPYLGFPHSWQVVIDTVAGSVIILLLLASKKKAPRETVIHLEETPRTLHVERMEVEERPEMHVERQTVVDTERNDGPDAEETTVEQRVTTVRRRRKNSKGKTSDAGEVDTP